MKAAVGSIVTLDESPATFTQLEILDPTVQLLAAFCAVWRLPALALSLQG